ncbi:MAG: leucine--tRNA ligase [Patescibacteria group bacterium]
MVKQSQSFGKLRIDPERSRMGQVLYEPAKIELKWQKVWEKTKIFSPDMDLPALPAQAGQAGKAKKPFYNLMMFPYPSAEGLHVGNMYAFTGADIYGRYTRMKGFDVFEPIGLDGFGIHSENYALKIGRHPAEQAKISEKNFYRQLHATGNAYDWSRTLETNDSEYYKWTQWIFVKMWQAGLAYKAEAPVNWCPSCKTVLADEQVIGGRCERCSSVVEQRQLAQWFFRITKYADRLLYGLSQINWSEKVKIAQRNWIGRSEGAQIEFKIQNSKLKIEVFTTRPDTLYGATFMVLAPENPLVNRITTSEYKEKVSEYVKKTSKREFVKDKEKTGVFTGSYAINPVNDEKIPIWVADYVSMEYGTGAIMGVPAHDQRDFEFAKKYNLPIKEVIRPSNPATQQPNNLRGAYEGEGVIINSIEWNGWKIPQDIPKVIAWLEENSLGKKQVHYHLRDWLISRQRYWGPPIPMIYCEVCAKEGKGEREDMPGWYAVPEKDLPVKLPYIKDYQPKGTGVSPLASHREFYRVACPECGSDARRETDVSDTFLDSAWYFLRYPSVGVQNSKVKMQNYNSKAKSKKLEIGNWKLEIPWNREITRRWLPVDMYIGGAEHSVLHLLYARFVTMVFKDWELIDFEEPFKRFYAHGLLISEGAKMSKSRGNVVIPDEYIKKYGADTLRMYLMFLGPFDQGGDFSDKGIMGMHRFLKRVWELVVSSRVLPRVSLPPVLDIKSARMSGSLPPVSPASHLRIMHKTIKEVTEDLENLRYNTAIAHIMEYYNQITNHLPAQAGQSQITKKEIETLLLLLAPFAPHMTEELWQMVRGGWHVEDGNKKTTSYALRATNQSIHLQPWPKYDPKLIQEEEAIIPVQIDGRLRDTLTINHQSSTIKGEVEKLARESSKIQKHLEGKKVKNVIFVPGKLINFVTE